MRLVAYDVEPPLRVLVAHGHHDAELALLLPGWTQFADALIDCHRRGARVGDDHGLAGELGGTVAFVVVDDVLAEGVDDLGGAEHGVEIREVALARVDGLGVGLGG